MQSHVAQCIWLPQPYRRAHRGPLAKSLAPDLDRLYPGGRKWLERRLDDVEKGKGRASVVCAGGIVRGVSIETFKGEDRIKLSTLWVDPLCRRAGIGGSLLQSCRNSWLQQEMPRVDITCASTVAPSLAPLLHRSGFRLEQVCRDRYGEGRHEIVFSWFSDPTPISSLSTAAVPALD